MSRLVCTIERSNPRESAANIESMARSLLPYDTGQLKLITTAFGDSQSGDSNRNISLAAVEGQYNGKSIQSSKLAQAPIQVILAGNIYNTKELAAQIGIDNNLSVEQFIAAGYQNNGTQFFPLLNGEFSFLLFDSKNQRLHVVRDRYGSNLLFCYQDSERIAIASEIKALLKHPKISAEPDFAAVHRYLFHNYRYSYGTKETFFKNVNSIQPNSVWTISTSGEKVETLWKFDIQENSALSDEDAIGEFHHLLEKSFQRRLDTVDSTPVFLLSGGLDSPTIAALASRRSSAPIKSYSILYGHANPPPEELKYDERDFIAPSVEMHSMDWQAVFPSPTDFPEVFEEMLLRYDEPISSPTWYSHYQLTRAIRDAGYTIAFGGDGGDHALAGLYDDIPYFLADLKASGQTDLFEHELALWEKLHTHPAFPKNRSVWEIYNKQCFDWNNPGKILDYSWDEERMRRRSSYLELCSAKFAENASPLPRFPSVSNRYLISKLWQDLLYASSPPSSRAEDINFSTFGVSLRSVFLDREFMEFCWSLPPRLMIRDGMLKYLIRAAMPGILPEMVRNKTEHVGLNSPANLWFRGELRNMIETTVAADTWKKLGIFDQSALKSILDEHLNAKADHMMFLWKVFSLERWFNKWGFV